MSHGFSSSQLQTSLTEYVDDAHRPPDAHEASQAQHHLLGVGRVLLLLLVLRLFSIALLLLSPRRRLALDTNTLLSLKPH